MLLVCIFYKICYSVNPRTTIFARSASHKWFRKRKTCAGEWVPMLRCLKKGCQTTCTLQEGFVFQFTDLKGRVNSKLTLYQITELLFMFVIEMPVGKTAKLTRRAKMTVAVWFEMCHTVCTSVLVERGKMVSTGKKPIQIDEARFAGWQKYNWGRVLGGDAPTMSNDEEADVRNMWNHSVRVDGPWVFGLRQGDDCCYFIVEW